MPGTRRRNAPAPDEDRQRRQADLRAEIATRAKDLQVLRGLLDGAAEGSHYQFGMRELVRVSDGILRDLIDECDRLQRRPVAPVEAEKPRAAKKARAKPVRRRG